MMAAHLDSPQSIEPMGRPATWALLHPGPCLQEAHGTRTAGVGQPPFEEGLAVLQLEAAWACDLPEISEAASSSTKELVPEVVIVAPCRQ